VRRHSKHMETRNVVSSNSQETARRGSPQEVDICLIVEGCYPYVPGGVSSWIDWLIRTQEEHSFAVVGIVAGRELRQRRFEFPRNLVHFSDLVLEGCVPARPLRIASDASADGETLVRQMIDLAKGGGLAQFARMVEVVNRSPRGLSLGELLGSRLAFDMISRMYETIMPHASFIQFYWAWRSLFGGVFSVLKFDLPRAKVYHAISTGYAGLLAARAALQTGRPAVVTEHGIYTNERRIEILMADWISDTVEKGLALDDERTDMRDLWIGVFEGYARVCYEACTAITTLYRDNQQLQLALGADVRKLKVIANGIEVSRFGSLARAAQVERPTIALIGRVVPIKDVKTFIAAAAVIRRRIPDLRVLIMGPTEEDAGYFEECSQLVAELALSDCITFTGNVRIADLMPTIHVIVLTSLSEAQPLVLLEGGAAGIPCVATNVGACREIIEGAADEEVDPQPGGFVTDLVAPDQVADRVCQLLADEALRRRLGETLRQRVVRYYATDMARQKYGALYRDLLDCPATRSRWA
jgi:glycosyltransferase involved in cell wall biosynthesis